MKPIVNNIYTLLMFLAYVMRRAGTFSMEEKVNMIEFLSYMALNPNRVVNPSMASLPFLSSASGVNAPIFSMVKSSAVNTDAICSYQTFCIDILPRGNLPPRPYTTSYHPPPVPLVY